MSALEKTNIIINAIKEQTDKALALIGKDRVDALDLEEAALRLKNIKERLEGLSEATDEVWQDAYAAGRKAERRED